jgi:hypothetical protein
MTDEQPPPELPDSSGVIGIIDDLMRAAAEAKSVPLSDQIRIDREALLRSLEQIKAELPEELRAARWMVREREAFIARTNEKAQTVLYQAQERARELVSESHVLAEAVEEANTLVRQAEGEARRIRLEAEDMAEDRLQHLEVLFANLLKQVRESRAEFHRSRPAAPEPPL